MLRGIPTGGLRVRHPEVVAGVPASHGSGDGVDHGGTRSGIHLRHPDRENVRLESHPFHARPVTAQLVLRGAQNRVHGRTLIGRAPVGRDYLDGKIARHYGLESRIGQLLDPVADRLYIVSTLLGLAWRDIIPWWLVAVLFAREIFMGVVVIVAQRHGWTGLPVHFVGKAATFNLLYAFPLLLLADGTGTFAQVASPIGWAFAWWGTILYWVAGILYAVQLRSLISRQRERVA